MQQKAVLERRIGGKCRVDHGRELEGVALDPLRVLAGTRILGAERGGERRDRFAVRALEQATLGALDLDQVPQVACVEDELLLVGARGGAAHGDTCARPRQALDDAEQLERAKRLRQQSIRAGGSCNILDVLHPGQQHDPDVAPVRSGLELPAE